VTFHCFYPRPVAGIELSVLPQRIEGDDELDHRHPIFKEEVVPPAPTDHAAPRAQRRRGRLALAYPAVAVAALAVLAAGCSSGSSGSSGSSSGGSSSSAPAASGGSGTKVTAIETEFHIALSTTTFSPGKYTFTAVDKGKLQHDLVINGPGVSDEKTQGLLAPGQSGSVTVTLKAGTYDIFCGVPGHKAQGMNVNIKVS
jgi:plastocyanin